MTRQELKSYAQFIVRLGEQHVEFARAVLKLLGELDKKEPPHPCHQQAVALWEGFLKKHGIPMVMDARQGKQLKELLNNLQDLAKDKSPQGALAAFGYILEKYELLSPWHQKNKTLSNINKNLQEVLTQIKNGTAKTNNRRTDVQQRAAERGALKELTGALLLQNGLTD